MKLHSYTHPKEHSGRVPLAKLNTRSLFISTTILVGILYTVCALFVAIIPQATMAFFGYISHLDLLAIAQPLTWGAFFIGLIFFALGTGVSAAFVGYYYNRMITK